MTGNHVHDMRPTGDSPRPAEYHCTSCAFRCTARVLGLVNASKSVHVLVRVGDPQAKKPWNG